MAGRCLRCSRDGEAPAPGSSFCEACRIALIRAGCVELALPGELDAAGRFTPYIEARRRAAAGL